MDLSIISLGLDSSCCTFWGEIPQNDAAFFSVHHIRRYMIRRWCLPTRREFQVLFLQLFCMSEVFFKTENSNIIVKKDLDYKSWLDISFVKAVIFKTFFVIL